MTTTRPPEAPASGWRPRHPTRSGLLLGAWSLLLAVLLLGPAIGPGFVLSYDMVWVPDLTVRPEVWGLGSSLPRAVPSDAVVAVLDEVVPGAWLQDVVLLGALVGGGLGVARLVPRHTVVRMGAVAMWQWNPFVVERLVLGHWPVLLGYAVLPWVVLLAARWRREGRVPGLLLVLVPLGSLSTGAGLATAVVLVLAAAGRGRWAVVALLLAASNAPWVVAGLLHAADARVDPAGAAVFALADEGSVPGPLAALTLGGVWNADVVPGSRTGALGWVALVVLVALAAAGRRSWWTTSSRRDRVVLLGAWAVGWVAGLVTWVAADAVGALAAVVPGAGLVRDGGRLLALCAPLLVVLVAHGVRRVLLLLPQQWPALAGAAVAAVLLPVSLLPDAAWGVSGRLQAVDYPAEWSAARTALAESAQAGTTGGGDVLLLPASAFRAPSWNGGRVVLDPLGRFLTPDPLAEDTLVVDGTRIAGEDRRAAVAFAALESLPAPRAAAHLAALGVGAVALDREAASRLGVDPPDLPGRPVWSGERLSVVALDGVVPDDPPPGWVVAMTVAWAAFVLGPVVGLVRSARRRGLRRLRSHTPSSGC